MMTLDPDDPFFQEDNDSHSQEDDFLKNVKDKQLYKDTMDLLKRKMCTAQDLLEQFNYKVKEYNELNLELHETKVDKEKYFNQFNSVSEKLTRLELANKDYEKSRDNYKNAADKQKLELNEKKNYIEQLEFKIKEMEKDNFGLKDEIKRIQQENKISKSVAKKATKNQGSQTIGLRTEQHEASTNTDFKIPPSKKPHMKDKNIITDITCAGKEAFPLFCSNCENHIESPPIGQILRIMSSPPPPSISNHFSPPCSPRSIPSNSQKSESIASHTFEQYFHENPGPSSSDKQIIKSSRKKKDETDRPSFMLIDKLTRKINSLERLVKKKKKHQDNSSHETCCASKNIKFIVQLPNEESYFNHAKRHRLKQPRLKRLNKKQIKSKSNKKLKVKEWQVESGIGSEVVESSLQHDAGQQSETEIDETNDLFESPAIDLSNSASKNQPNSDSLASGTVKTTYTESSNTLDANADKVIVKLTNEDMVLDDEDKCSIQSRVSNPVLCHTNSHENVVKEAKSRTNSKKVLPSIENGCNLSLHVLKRRYSNEVTDLDNDSFTKEFDKNKITHSKIKEKACEITENEEINDQAVILKSNSSLESQDDYNETEITSLYTKTVSISSTSASENDELFSASTVYASTDKDPHSDITKPKNEQDSILEVDNDQIHSLVIGKTEVVDSPASPTNSVNNSVETKMNTDMEIREDTVENEQYSDESLNPRFFAAKDKMREKGCVAIDSDSSSEEIPELLNKNKRRKILIAQRKKLLSKLNKLKKTSNFPITSKPTAKAIPYREEITDTYIPTKKQRIAHIPKDVCEVKEVISTDRKDTCKIQEIESKDLLSEHKPLGLIMKTSSIENLPLETKKAKLTKKARPRMSTKKQPATLDMAQLKPLLSDTESIEIADKDEGDQTIIETDIKEHKHEENDQEEKEKCEISGDNFTEDTSVSETATDKTESIENSAETVAGVVSGENTQTEEALDDSIEESCVVKRGLRNLPARRARFSPCKQPVERPVRRLSRRLQENSLPLAAMSCSTQNVADENNCSTDTIPKQNDTDGNDSATGTIAEQSDADANNCTTDTLMTSPERNKTKTRTKSKKANKLPFLQTFNSTNSSLSETAIVSHFNNFLMDTNKENKLENFEPLKSNGKFIRKQLSVLIETEPLTTDVLTQVSESLLNIIPLDVVALVLVEFASTEYLDDIKSDTTYTPPAPPMTKLEQKLVTLIMRIKDTNPEFMDAIEKGLQYKLFRLGKFQEAHIVERLFRMLVTLNKIKKDREKVRMLFCDALYCYNTQAINIIHITLSCWSEVFPKFDSNNDILVKTIVHIVMSSNVNRPFSKLMPLKKLLTDYYGYPNSGFRVENFKQELIDNLKENVPGTNSAIILLCKNKGAEWTLENMIKDLKQIIVDQLHPSMYDVLTLLGDVLRPFASESLKSSLVDITDQLCEVLNGNPGLHDLEEGIVSCLLTVGGKFTFTREKIARCVLNWHPTQELRQTTKEKFTSFLKTHTAGWWRKFVHQNFPVTNTE